MSFKRANPQERQEAVNQRLQKGLAYIRNEVDIDIYTPADGDNQIRIIPPLADDQHATLWGLEVWTYYLNNKSMLSSKTFDSSANDPVSTHFFSTREWDPAQAKKYKGVKRHLMYVLDLATSETVVKLWAAPPTLVDEFINLAKDKRSGELIPLEDPENGRIIFFRKEGTGINTRYKGTQLDHQAYPISEQMAEQLYKFEELLVVPTASELESVLAIAQSDKPLEPELTYQRPSHQQLQPVDDEEDCLTDPAPGYQPQQPVEQPPVQPKYQQPAYAPVEQQPAYQPPVQPEYQAPVYTRPPRDPAPQPSPQPPVQPTQPVRRVRPSAPAPGYQPQQPVAPQPAPVAPATAGMGTRERVRAKLNERLGNR